MAKAPQRVGRYELLRRIGAGGMGEVWLSRLEVMPGVDKLCVVKKILPHLSFNKSFVGRFLDEAKVVVQLNHGNIAQVFEMGKDDDEYFMAMEYVEGKTLARIASRLRERGENFPLGLALYIGSRVCDGLAYAHRKTDPTGHALNVVHRDISPSNVVISYEGEVKIIDFGAAQSAVKEEQTAPRVVIGNLLYMSPEQARKQPVDGRADLFSTSVVLWELISWQVLPSEGDYVARWRRAAYPSFDPPSKFSPEIPPEVDEVLAHGLAPEADDRPPSADAFRDELQLCLARIAPAASQSSLAGFMRGLFESEAQEERDAVRDLLNANRDREKARQPRKESADLFSTGNDHESVTAPAADLPDPAAQGEAPKKERDPGPARSRGPSRVARPAPPVDPEATDPARPLKPIPERRADPSEPSTQRRSLSEQEQDLLQGLEPVLPGRPLRDGGVKPRAEEGLPSLAGAPEGQDSDITRSMSTARPRRRVLGVVLGVAALLLAATLAAVGLTPRPAPPPSPAVRARP